MSTPRQRLILDAGTIVKVNGAKGIIKQCLNFDQAVVEFIESGKLRTVAIKEIEPCDTIKKQDDLQIIAGSDWEEANRRYKIILPLLESSTRISVDQVATMNSIDKATVYRWLKQYKMWGTIDALRPKKNGLKTGNTLLDINVEKIIEKAINDVYLNKQRASVQKVIQEVQRLCIVYKILNPPHANTIRSRVASLSPRIVLNKRGFEEKARNKYSAAAGKFPNANYPLSVVQIDHTPVDLILVDDTHRQPIGRPYVTLAIDVFSRMIVGYYLSFDPPSETSVAMCIGQSVLPKEQWIAQHDVDAEWPAWGVMTTIHVDNAVEFRSRNFKDACIAHGIRLEYRPVAQPRFGAHIERLIGTFAQEVHHVPGTTFSSIKDREGYNSDKNAVLTLAEFERWLITWICKVYHIRRHTGIGMSPIQAWELGVFGDEHQMGSGLPQLPANQEHFFLDFLPSFKRTIQTTGVAIDGLRYYSDVLRGWINALSSDGSKEKRKFIFRRNPQDIGIVWFYDPELKEYFKIPFADQSIPFMSEWEYRRVRDMNKKRGEKISTNNQLVESLQELRQQVEQASKKTRRERLFRQRTIEHQKNKTPVSVYQQQDHKIAPQATFHVADLLPIDQLVDVEEDIV